MAEAESGMLRGDHKQSYGGALSRFQMIAECIGCGYAVSLCDERHTYVYVGARLLSMTGYGREDFMKVSRGSALEAVFMPDRAQTLRHWQGVTGGDGAYTARYRVLRGDGTLVWFKESARKIRTDTGEYISSTFADITEEMEHHERLERQINNDSLTGLLHHRAAFDAGLLAFGCEGTPGGAVLVIDVDNFKAINDTKGHWQGDDVLRTFAHILTDCAPKDACVGRIGGDEFMVLLRSGGQAGARELAEDILTYARAVFKQSGVTCSIGVAGTCEGRRRFKEVFNAADAALYQAKQRGRNRVEEA